MRDDRGGWIAVTRKSFNHPAFKRSEVSEAEAWHRLVARAAHSPTRHRIKSEVKDVGRGSFFCTLRDLQSEFMWRSDARVRNFLKMLENERMIERTANAGKTHVTICNYDDYQGGERTENAQNTQTETQAERKPNALKNKETIKQGSTIVERTRTKAPKFPDFIRPEIAAAFIEHRKAKKAKLGERAMTLLNNSLHEIQSMGIDPNDALDLAIVRNWTSIDPKWDAVKELKGSTNERPNANRSKPRREYHDPILDASLERARAADRARFGCDQPGDAGGMDCRQGQDDVPAFLQAGRRSPGSSGGDGRLDHGVVEFPPVRFAGSIR